MKHDVSTPSPSAPRPRLWASGEPLPYSGQELDRREHLGRPWVKTGHGSDQGDGRPYRFNRLGFRGPEFDPEAPYRIYAFGESHAFGYFVEADECWPARFAAHWAQLHDLEPREVCFQNFSDVGAANAGIAREVIRQCSAAPPDLVLVHFAEHRRSEVYLEGLPHRVGPWLLEEATARAAPSEEPLRSHYLRQIERAHHFYDFALGPKAGRDPGSLEVDATCFEDTLRSLLLVQFFCRARQLPVVATCDLYDDLFAEYLRHHETLGPLLEQVDPGFLCPLRLWTLEGDHAADGHHAGPQRHDRFARALLEHHRRHRRRTNPDSRKAGPASTSDRREGEPASTPGGAEVRAFYDAMPFNHWSNPRAAARTVREPGALAAYPDLERLLERGKIQRAIDAGCGAGWLACTLAFHHPVEVVGIDFSSRALERAREVARATDVASRTRFVEHDLLELDALDLRPVDLVVSLGALHHTTDPRRALSQVLRCIAPGGHLYLGLYHAPGRAPFLEHFRRILDEGGEEAAFERFAELARDLRRDEEHLQSWFRDQVLHPLESQHTLRQVASWLDGEGFGVDGTSINRFSPIELMKDGGMKDGGMEALFELETTYGERSRRALAENRFFPGFFTVLASRR